MAFNRATDKQYEQLLMVDGDLTKLEDWKELRDLEPVMHDKIRQAKTDGDIDKATGLMLESTSISTRKRKIEEELFMLNKSVL